MELLNKKLCFIIFLLLQSFYSYSQSIEGCNINTLRVGQYEITNLPCIQDSTRYGKWVEDAEFLDEEKRIIINNKTTVSRTFYWRKHPPTKPKIKIYDQENNIILEGDIYGANFNLVLIDSSTFRRIMIAKTESNNGGFSIGNIKYNFNNILGGQLDIEKAFTTKGRQRYLKIEENLTNGAFNNDCRGILTMEFDPGLALRGVNLKTNDEVFSNIDIEAITPVNIVVGTCDGKIKPIRGKFAVKNMTINNLTRNDLALNKFSVGFQNLKFNNLEIEFERTIEGLIEAHALLEDLSIKSSHLTSKENPSFKIVMDDDIAVKEISIIQEDIESPLNFSKLNLKGLTAQGDIEYYNQHDEKKHIVLDIPNGHISFNLDKYNTAFFKSAISIKNFQLVFANQEISSGEVQINEIKMSLQKESENISGEGYFDFRNGSLSIRPIEFDVTSMLTSQNDINLESTDRGDFLRIAGSTNFSSFISNFKIDQGVFNLQARLPPTQLRLKSNTYSGNFRVFATYKSIKNEIKRVEDRIVKNLPWPLDDIVQVVVRTITVPVEIIEDFYIHMNVSLGPINSSMLINDIALSLEGGKARLCGGSIRDFNKSGFINAKANFLYASHSLIPIPDTFIGEVTQPIYKYINETNLARGFIINNIFDQIFETGEARQIKILGSCD